MLIYTALILCITLVACSIPADAANKSGGFDLETRYVRITVDENGAVTGFYDKQGRTDYSKGSLPIAQIKKNGAVHAATKASYSGENITLTFGDSGVSAVLRAKNNGSYLVFEVVSVSGDAIDELEFFNHRLNLHGRHTEPFAACLLALNVQTNIYQMPGHNSVLNVKCYPKFGMVGAEAALIACPSGKMRDIMKEAILAAPDLPHSKMGGPWAYDSKLTRGSYVFNHTDLTESTADKWIEMMKSIGISQIDFHGGTSFRFGDCLPNPNLYPEGKKSLKAVIDRLHEAGILAGLHTYSFFIDKRSPWVTPVPNPGLAKAASFTLSADISDSDTTVPVDENTEKMSTIMGFAVRNSVTLQIDDELVVFKEISKDAPFGFTECMRGAYGTKAAPHSAGATVHHLKELYGLFSPDPDSKLYMDMVEANADLFNECGFDMMYLDALDGADILSSAGGEYWHYGSKFAFDLVKRLKKDPIMEMSTFYHHLWYLRSRAGAWDHPNRGYKVFVDLHISQNEQYLNMFLPGHLGWWSVATGENPHREATYSDDFEYLLAKCAGWDWGFSPAGFSPETYAANYNLQRLGALIKKWEDLRQTGFFSEKQKQIMREPGAEFTLVEENGQNVLRRVSNIKHRVNDVDSASANWITNNSHGAQPAKLRIVALTSLAPYDDPAGKTIIDFKDTAALGIRSASQGTQMEIAPSTDVVKTGGVSGHITAESSNSSNRRATWAKIGHDFAPVGNFEGCAGMGVWVYGDGKGEVINIQLTSPYWLMGGLADHYITVDFHGWRYFELVEPEGDRVGRYEWPHSRSAYATYREYVRYANIKTVSVWCNNLPPGDSISCYISPIKALPQLKNTIANPTVTVNGKTIRFPVELQTNWYLEYNSETDCKLFDELGNFVADIKPESEHPTLVGGDNIIRFSCDKPAQGSARAVVTVTSIGEHIDK